MRRLLLGMAALSLAWGMAIEGPITAGHASPSATYQFLEETVEGSFDLEAGLTASADGEARLCFNYRSPEDHCYIRFTRRSASLVRVQAGKPAELARPVDLSPGLSEERAPVVIQRRPQKLVLIYRSTTLLVVGDRDPGEGKVGWSTEGGLAVDEPGLQPFEPPLFTDDFMREAAEPGPWETVSGEWSTTTVGDVKKSANGFSFRGTGAPAVATAGHPFWDDYVFQASFRAADTDAAVGLCLNYQDPENYLALLWTSGEGLRLVRVLAGQQRILAHKPIAWVPGQWYRLGAQVLDGDLTAMIDGNVCLQARDAAFGRGKVALYTEGKDAHFDDIAVKPALYLHDTSPSERRERWLVSRGAHIIGCPTWQDYTYRLQAEPKHDRGVSIVFGWRGPEDYCVFRWGSARGRGASAGRQQIVRVNGEEKVLADAPGGYSHGRRAEVEITYRPGYAAVAIDGKRVLETGDVPLDGRGSVGVAPITSFRELTVALREEPPPPEEEITREFTDAAAHPDMAEWATPAKAWVPRTADGKTIYWRKGEHYGDTWVSASLPAMAPDAQVAVSLAADGENAESGYSFVLQRPGTGKLTVRMLRQATAVRSVTADVGTDGPVSVTLSRQGSHLAADLDDKRVLEYQDMAPLGGTRVGIQAAGFEMDLKQVRVKSLNVYDYTFHDAPTDWQPHAGVWEITNRWSCSPGWSWFGGRSEGMAVVWNKRRFAGDLVLEYYAAPKMDAVPEAYAQRFRDLNATICADGKELNTGYSFIIGGWGNTKTAILRGHRIVAETTDYRLPPHKAGHRLWFYVRIEKRGSKLSLAVDNKPLLTFEDPAPLGGDRMALWTHNNGMMLARVVASFQDERAMPPVTRAPAREWVQAAAPVMPGSVPDTGPVVAAGPPAPKIGGAGMPTAPPAPKIGGAGMPTAPPAPKIGGAGMPTAPPAPLAPKPVPTLRWDKVALTDTFSRGTRARWEDAQGKWAVDRKGFLAPEEKPEDGYAYAFTGSKLWRDCEVEAELLNGQDAGIIVRGQDWDHCVLLIVRPAQGDLWWFVRQAGQWGPVLAPVDLGLKPKPSLKVRVTAIGDTFTCYLDGKQVSQLKDTTYASGRIGLYVNTALEGQAWDNLSVRVNNVPPPPKVDKTAPPPARLAPDARVLVADAFDDGKMQARWDGQAGRWAPTPDGRFAPTEKPGFAYALAGDPAWRDYEVSATLVNGQDAGILVHAQDWDNCVFLVIRPAQRDCWWITRQGGQWSSNVLAQAMLDFGPKKLLKVRVTVVGDTYTCTLDGKQITQLQSTTHTQGRVGVYVNTALDGQAWDDVAVTALDRKTAAR